MLLSSLYRSIQKSFNHFDIISSFFGDIAEHLPKNNLKGNHFQNFL